MTIYFTGDAARRFSLTNRTIRFYDQQGLLTPQRRGQHRIYSEDDLQKLEVILQASAIGIGVGEIAQIVRRGEEALSPWRLQVDASAAVELLKAARLRHGHLEAAIARLEEIASGDKE